MRLQPGHERDMISDEMKVSELMEANGRDWRPEIEMKEVSVSNGVEREMCSRFSAAARRI
ncbi:hypothetical protein DY000_02023922 [Brassica cretica]|uniref:Uncharacterized protein n=1 Tax=Brassica cretica TaxID=69181 RepID=A0ABQ7E2U3_BRACR|nr:hypothetical protein DY000_02023922 [Brassica cretica]